MNQPGGRARADAQQRPAPRPPGPSRSPRDHAAPPAPAAATPAPRPPQQSPHPRAGRPGATGAPPRPRRRPRSPAPARPARPHARAEHRVRRRRTCVRVYIIGRTETRYPQRNFYQSRAHRRTAGKQPGGAQPPAASYGAVASHKRGDRRRSHTGRTPSWRAPDSPPITPSPHGWSAEPVIRRSPRRVLPISIASLASGGSSPNIRRESRRWVTTTSTSTDRTPIPMPLMTGSSCPPGPTRPSPRASSTPEGSRGATSCATPGCSVAARPR